MKQTAVEWLVQEINKINVSTEARRFINKLEKQAKEMEKQQIIEVNKQKQHLIDIMEGDEELGLYEQIDQNNPVTKGSTALVYKQETLEETAEREYPTIHEQYQYDAFIEGAKWQEQQNDTSKVTRVEVIQHSPPYNGRAFTKYNAKDVEIQFQYNGRTLKIFLK